MNKREKRVFSVIYEERYRERGVCVAFMLQATYFVREMLPRQLIVESFSCDNQESLICNSGKRGRSLDKKGPEGVRM